VSRLARTKAAAIASTESDAWVLGGDTVVVAGGSILGQPRDATHARDMLRLLSGGRHEVLTSVALAGGSALLERIAVASVRFRELDDETIEAYVASGEPMGKAGAYAVQELGATLVAAIEGDPSTVAGLPLSAVIELLDEAGIPHRLRPAESSVASGPGGRAEIPYEGDVTGK
jgi:septum formation protein